MTEKKWGGKREGAGRPKQEKVKKQYTFRLSEEELKAVREVLVKMRGKLVILLFTIMMLFVPVNATTLTGGVEYTEETARQAAFEGVLQYLTFPNKATYNHILFQTTINYENVIAVADFKSMLYGVIPYKTISIIYKDDPGRKYYYEKTSRGYKCVAVDVVTNTNDYPIKAVKYLASTGKLLSIGFYVSPYEDFVFDANGKLIEHWIKNKAQMSYGKRQIKYFGQ